MKIIPAIGAFTLVVCSANLPFNDSEKKKEGQKQFHTVKVK
jgi:hypothetical protein